MRMFITSKNKYLSNDIKIFGTCSIPLMLLDIVDKRASYTPSRELGKPKKSCSSDQEQEESSYVTGPGMRVNKWMYSTVLIKPTQHSKS